MNRLLRECVSDESCAYLDDRQQRTHYKIIDNCSQEYCESLIERGWRRFGNMFFRPVCSDCNACESFRIDTKNYQFTKSQRRILRKNAQTRVVVQRPQVTTTHLELFEKYHLHMRDKRDWSHESTDARHYYVSFVHGHGNFGYELLYYIDDKLVGVDLVDLLPNGISSIYFYYDPDYEKYSLGTYSMLHQIQIAQDHGLDWIYMGYYVEGCQSLEYKSRYKPYEVLEGRPEEEHEPQWLKAEPSEKSL